MNKMKRILSMLLCISMAISNVQIVSAEEANSTEQYSIYPIVRDIEYDGTEFVLDSEVNVVYEAGIDNATKGYLTEVLTENGITAEVVNAPVNEEFNILLGVNGSNGAADTYENQLDVKTANLYTQHDAYLLEAKEDQITIVGKDSDAVYWGIATLKMMLSSFENNVLLGAKIEDYAGIEFRGFIEGFYGGWDYETRAELMRFARDVKMNMYVYASKTDTYHTTNWAGLYPENEIEEIKELVKIGQETKCYYVWSVHLGSFFNGLNISSNPSLYQTRYDQLVAKFTQLYDAGVRKFDILNDDFGSGSHADVVTLLNDLTEKFIEPKGCEPITYCPQGYNEAWSKWTSTINELPTLKDLDDSIMIYWTGADVNSPITQSTVNYVSEKTGGQPVAYWLNYPVNEHAKSGIYLGNIDHYARDGVTGLRAAVSNPSRFGQSNKVALFQLASLFWNNSNYSAHSEDVWLDSFNYLEEGVEEAYRTIGRNLANCPNSSRVGAGFPESEYIKANLEAVLTAVSNGEAVADLEDTEILLNEFANILEAIETFRKDCKNKDLVAELDPWLNSLVDAVIAAEGSLSSVVALEEENYADAWSSFAEASKAFQTWNTYKSADDIPNPALGGSKRIQPFAAELVGYVESTLTPVFDANYSGQNLIAVLGGQKKSLDDNAAKLFDADEETSTQWNTIQQKDDYFGVDLGVVKPITDICIVQGNTDTDHDIFHKAVLEYSEDGKNYTQLGNQYNDTYRIQLDDLDIEARFVRLRLVETGTAAKQDYWTHVREFTVNKQRPDGDRVYTNVEAYAKQPLTITGNEYSLSGLENVTLESGEYLGIKFTNLVKVSSIFFEGTGLEGLEVWFSENSTQCLKFDENTEQQILKYIWIENSTGEAITFDLDKLAVVVENTKANPKFLETNLTNGIREGNWENVFDGNESTHLWTNENQVTGDYITFDFGAVIELYDLEIVTADGNPRLYNAKIQISTDNASWETIATVENDNSIFEVPYRYVRTNANGEEAKYLRIYFTGNREAYLKIQEIFFNKTVEENNETAEITANFGNEIENAIDGNLSTIFAATAAAGDSITYKFTESTNLHAISILQDPENISNATVEVLKDDGYVEIGKLDESAKKFKLDSSEYVFRLKISFDEETDLSLYEIYLDADKSVSDDIGEYVDPIIKEEEGVAPVEENLTIGKTITVSGTSDGNKDHVNDGDTNTKWDSNNIKSGTFENAQDTGDSWIYVDLGNEKTSIFDETIIKYFNKIYPTLMQIQISNDAANWITVNELTRGHNQSTHPVITDTYENAYTARYVRLYFEELNNAAGGNGVGITEWEINGVAVADLAVKSVETFEDKTVELNTSADTFELKDFVNVVLTHETYGDYEVLVPVTWNTSAYDATAAGTYVLEGNLNLPATVANAGNLKATLNVIIEGEETAPVKGNIAPGKTITVSGTSAGDKGYVNDGDLNSKWDSDLIKSGTGENAQDIGDAWVQIDLGNTKTSIFDASTIRYYNMVYPTLMEVQISNDGTNWVTVSELTREHNGTTHPVVTDIYEPPFAARYMRLYFKELNNVAYGHGVGINEWEIQGIEVADLALKSVETFEDKTVELNTSADNFGLKNFVKVVLTHESFGDYEILVPVTWDTSSYNEAEAGTYTIEGTLNLPSTVANEEGIKATFDVIVEAEEEAKKEVCEVFADVNHGAWYEGSVQYVYDEGIIIGDGNIFAPDNGTTRAMVAVILYRLAGSPDVIDTDYEEYNKFGDLPEEKAWYSDAVAWALKEKVSTGDDYAILYNPELPVTREQLALFLWRYAKYTGEDVTVDKTDEELFGDTYVNSWAKEGFAWAVDREIIRGAEETDSEGNLYYVLNPQGGATRAQLARMLHRYIGGATD